LPAVAPSSQATGQAHALEPRKKTRATTARMTDAEELRAFAAYRPGPPFGKHTPFIDQWRATRLRRELARGPRRAV